MSAATRGSIVALVLVAPSFGASPPVPVSPGAEVAGVAVEARCPTFLWSGVPDARAYEVAVFRVGDDGEDPELVDRRSLPGDARGWAPPAEHCLERGGRYAWSVGASKPDGALEWSRPFLFTVAEAPDAEDVKQALATLERYLAANDEAPVAARTGSREEQLEAAARAPRSVLPGPLTAPTTTVRDTAAAVAPALGTASLDLAGQLHLANASAVFKNDDPFLWDDTTGNLALGRQALGSAKNGSGQNVAVGREALSSTETGGLNTAVGHFALRVNTGFGNTGLGNESLLLNVGGSGNTAIGSMSLRLGTSGYRNTAIGQKAGYQTGGHDNILIHNDGSTDSGESHVLRIGQSTSSGETPAAFSLDKVFIQGIHNRTIASGAAVVINASGQLGTVSSSRRFKRDIQDLGEQVDRMLELRPVAYRFEELVAADPEMPFEFGLISEEVAEVLPELVVFDDQGRPESVKYHLLSALLLGEVQRLHERLEAMESQPRSARRRRAGAH